MIHSCNRHRQIPVGVFVLGRRHFFRGGTIFQGGVGVFSEKPEKSALCGVLVLIVNELREKNLHYDLHYAPFFCTGYALPLTCLHCVQCRFFDQSAYHLPQSADKVQIQNLICTIPFSLFSLSFLFIMYKRKE